MRALLFFILLPVVFVSAFSAKSSDPVLGSETLGGLADKMRGWTETAWSSSKVSYSQELDITI